MNRQKLNKKRFIPCFNEIYSEAKCAVDTKGKVIDWDFLQVNAPLMHRKFENQIQILFPYDCFYLSHDRLMEIIRKHTKGLRGSWYFPYKFGNLNDPNWKENDKVHEKILMDFRAFEDEVSKDKSLTPYQRRTKIKARAIQDGFQWRVWDAEAISMNICLGPSPTSNEETVKTCGKIYEMVAPTLAEIAKGIYKPWRFGVSQSREEMTSWEVEELKMTEAKSFDELVDEVTSQCFNKIHDELGMDKFGYKRYIQQVTALWIMLNF